MVKGLSHEGIKKATEKAKAEKAAPAKPSYRSFLKRMTLASHGKNDDEVPRIVKEMQAIVGEFSDAYPDKGRGDVPGRDRMKRGGHDRAGSDSK